MGKACHNKFRSTGCRLVLVFCIGLLQTPAQAAQSSDLSRWLSASLAPQLTRLLADHPRYRGGKVSVVNLGGDALSDTIALTLRSALAGESRISLVTPAEIIPAAGYSIDDLNCLDSAAGELQLQVDLRENGTSGDRVSIMLLETESVGDESPRLWQWSGKLTRTERTLAMEPGEARVADGSLDAPWRESDVEAAAGSLSRDFACSLRPGIATHLRLEWSDNAQLPPVLRDTVNTSRHQLGSYRELALTTSRGEYRVSAELRPFRGDLYQLWLNGRPQVPLRDPVQAVTYFRLAEQISIVPPEKVIRELPSGKAIDYLQVEMLGARQADKGRSGADLRIALRLVNQAEWPIAYGLRLSGGHFMHCIARSDYYRHDRYGALAGTLAPGASEVRDLVVEKLQHNPLPWFGAARCAGSADLDALENYATRGHRVTDYVRWDL